MTPKRLSLEMQAQKRAASPGEGVKKRPPPPPPGGKREKPVVPERPKFLKKKKRPAPPPPLPFRRNIAMTENLSKTEIEHGLNSVSESQNKLEEVAEHLEDQLIELIDKDAENWAKNSLVDEWMVLVKEKCDLWRKEATLVHMWNQNYLDEFHSDIEFYLRCILEKPDCKKTEQDTKMEAKLLELLIDVIDRKNRLVENEKADMHHSPRPDNSSLERDSAAMDKKDGTAKKKKKLKIRLKKIKKKLAHHGRSPSHE